MASDTDALQFRERRPLSALYPQVPHPPEHETDNSLPLPLDEQHKSVPATRNFFPKKHGQGISCAVV